MSTVMKISPQGQIRIPKKVMQTLNIEKGDYVEVEIDQNQIILKPRKLIDPIQGWYWTKEWQKMEVEVDKEIKKNTMPCPIFELTESGGESKHHLTVRYK